MDRRIEGAVTAAVLVSLCLSLAACGGGSGSSEAAAAAPSPAAETIDGVTTPRTVSVVTAKNAD